MPYTIMLMRMKIGVIIGATTATATTVKFDFNYQLAHSDDRDQSFQRIATSVTWVRDGAVGCCF